MEEKKRDIDQQIAESLVEIPITFMVGRKKMHIKPKTLGKDIMLRQYKKKLGIDTDNVYQNLIAESLRIAKDKPEETARVIAIYTLEGPDNIKDPKKIEARAKELSKEATTQDLASLLAMCIDEDLKVQRFIEHAKLDKDKENIRKINEVKGTRNCFTFNGKTIWGQLIGSACERFGWSLDYVLWGISCTNLQMLMADQVVTMTLTDEERKKVSLANVHDSIRVDDPANAERIKLMFKNIEED